MNIFNEFEKIACNHGNETAIVYVEKSLKIQKYTYFQVLEKVDAFAQKLKNFGINSGSRLGIACENLPSWNFLFLACAKLNICCVLFDSSLPAGELNSLILKGKICCLAASPNCIKKATTSLHIPILNICDNLSLCADFAQIPANTNKMDENASVIIFSSGTTRLSEGIIHSHNSQILSCKMVCKSYNISNKDRILSILPNNHIYGLFAGVLAPMLTGGQVCFLESIDNNSLNFAFNHFKPTIFPAVPKIFQLIYHQSMENLNSSRIQKILLKAVYPICYHTRKLFHLNLGKFLFSKLHTSLGSHIRLMCSAGSPISDEIYKFFFAAGFFLVNNYGSTETNIPTIGYFKHPSAINTCGKVYPDIKMKISPNGEILIKSPYMMIGYFNNFDAASDIFTNDGWFKTGDLAKIDKKGNVFINGRIKENIVLPTGKKVAPQDIENAYNNAKIPQELVVCGIPSKNGYDEIHAFAVCPRNLQKQAEKEIFNISGSLSQPMRITKLHFIDYIPKTSLGKPKRYILQKLSQEENLVSDECIHLKESHSSPDDIPFIVKKAVADAAGIPYKKIKLSNYIFKDLSIDSIGVVELSADMEKTTNVKIDQCINQDITVGSLINFVQNPNYIDKIHKKTSKSSLYSGIYPMKKRKIDYKIFRLYLNIAKTFYDLNIKNQEVLPTNGGYIICSNHVSGFDYLFLAADFKYERFSKFCCLAKNELFNDRPINRLLIRIGGMIPVDREGEAYQAMSAAKRKLSQKWGILIHPEGTRSKNGEIGEFKKGAAKLAIQADVPIIPAYIKGGYEIFPSYKKIPRLFNWRKLRKYSVTVTFGKPIFPKNNETPPQLTKRIRHEITKLKESN